jgi:hypothetical protein
MMEDESLRRYLVLVTGMLAGPGPGQQFYRLSQTGPSAFYFLVPATRPEYGWAWTEGQSLADANERLGIMLDFARQMGMNVDGEVVPTTDAVEAVRHAVAGAKSQFAELIVVDRPRGLDRWLARSALEELKKDPGLPITHLEADPPMRQGKQFDAEELRAGFAEVLRGLSSP